MAELFREIEAGAGSPLTYYVFPQERGQATLAATANEQYHFVDPSSGSILKSTERPARVMAIIRALHTNLLMGEFGTWIGIVSSCFLVALCATGGYLFLKRRLKLRTLFRIRRQPAAVRHYDLHAVAGFVTALPIALIALSGVLIGLGAAWRETILFITDSQWKPRPQLETAVERPYWNFSYEAVLEAVQVAAPKGMRIDSIALPQDPEEPLRFRLLYHWATRPASWAFVNPGNGQLMEFHHHWDYEAGHLIHRLNRGFHSGELFTDAMRWLWLVLMLVPFLLAYTGYRQWSRKRRPRSQQQSR